MNEKNQRKKQKIEVPKVKGTPHLKQTDRDRIESLWRAGETQKNIGLIVGRSQSNISREISHYRKKNRCKGGTKNGDYVATIAQQKATAKRSRARHGMKKINEDARLQDYVIDKLKKYWSPDTIAGRMKKDNEPFYASKDAIYEWLYSRWGQQYCRFLYSERYRPKKQKENKTKKTLIPNRVGWQERPEGCRNKTEFGHKENDTILSGKKTKSKVALSVEYDRKSKYGDALKIDNLRPETNRLAILKMEEDKLVLSHTLDNGIENTEHEQLKAPCFFCDPYSPWQKGGVEHFNKMIRWFIPKGCDIGKFSQEYVNMIIDILNKKPRKSLGYKTPLEVMIENNLFLTKNSLRADVNYGNIIDAIRQGKLCV
jgi:IS30 family transposase